MNKIYTYDEVREASLAYFDGDQLAASTFADKYALQDLQNNYHELTPVDMHKRMANEFARIESLYNNPLSYDEILALFADWTVIPQGSPMSALGNKFQIQSLSNCFVIDSPHDSYGGILHTDQEQVQIMKRRGGIGFDLSTIRPKGCTAANAARTTDGIAVFMERFSNTCEECAQNGRRGALMLTMHVAHPEVLTFANIKRDRSKVTGANVSVRLTDEFMRAVEKGDKYRQCFPVEGDGPKLVDRMVDAREVWENIIKATRDCSEPGYLFWDTIKRNTPTDAYPEFATKSTNPCGEIVLTPYDSCRLLLINLSKFVHKPFTPDACFDMNVFDDVVRKSQRLMDDLVDLELEAVDKILAKIESDPEPEYIKVTEQNLWKKIKKMGQRGRRTGLGLTALGDIFAYLGMAYGSDESIRLTDEIYKHLALNSYRSSVRLAEERGAFPAFDHGLENNHPFINKILDLDPDLRERYNKFGRRNIANTTTAPAGSTSILAKTTSGCEPVVFIDADRFKKNVPGMKNPRVDKIDEKGIAWQKFKVFHEGVKLWMDVTGESDVTKSPYAGSTVEEIDHLKKVDMQAAAQNWVCHSISNTTNLPNDVTSEKVASLAMRSWKTECKGLTIYRIGSRDAVIKKASVENEPEKLFKITETHAPKRPKELPCDIHRVSVKGEQYVVFVGKLGNRPYEIFAGLSEYVEVPRKVKNGVLIKNGKHNGVVTYNLRIPIGSDDDMLIKNIVNLFANAEHGAFTRTLSLALRHGVPVQYIVEQLRKDKKSDMSSFSSVIARVLSKQYIPDGTSAKTFEKLCPECNSDGLTYQQGCITCFNCGYSKCA